VLKRLGEPQKPATQPVGANVRLPAANAGKRVLVVLTGGNRNLDDVFTQVGRIADQAADTTVVLSPSAEKTLTIPAVRRAAPGARIIGEGDVWSLLEEVSTIYLPSLSLNAASKISMLMPDSLACILAVYGLLQGKTVVAASDTLLPAEIDPASVPLALRQKLDAILKELERLGMRLCPVKQMTCTASASAQAGGEHSNGSCAQKDSGECDACGACVENRPNAIQDLVSSGAARLGSTVGARPTSPELAGMIDHTVLKPDATEEMIRKLCEEAKQHNFASVCVNPSWVSLCAQLLAGSGVPVCTVIGFPLGATTPTAKAIETRDAVANGATEIDMVINVGALKSGDDDLVRRDIQAVVAAAGDRALVKTILETALLSKEEIVKACLLAKMAGADFVKTSTGFGPGGATVEDIALMRETVGPDMGVKASGGIKDRQTAEAMVAAGATRIGASASVAIATGKQGDKKGY